MHQRATVTTNLRELDRLKLLQAVVDARVDLPSKRLPYQQCRSRHGPKANDDPPFAQ
jgi:hypothetical protein